MNSSSSSPSEGLGPVLLTVALLCGIFLVNFLSRVSFGPLMPVVEPDLGLTHVQAGAMFLMISFGYSFSLAGSGFVSARLGHKATLLISAGGVGLALFWTSAVRTPVALQLGLVLLGLGGGLYLPSAVAVITRLTPPQNWGKALAIHEVAPNMALLSSPVLAEIVLSRFHWSRLLVGLGFASLAAGLVFAWLGKGGGRGDAPPALAAFASIFRRPSLWLMMFLFSLALGGSLGIYAMMSLYLVNEGGLARPEANALLAYSRVAGLFLTFFAGWITDRLGPRRAMTWVLAGGGLATTAVGMLTGPGLVAAVFIQAALTACFFPPGLAALARVGRPEQRGVAVSSAIPVAYLVGGGLLPSAVGWMGERYSFSLGVTLAGVVILSGAFLVHRLRFADEEAPAGAAS
jgi:NNP family nitrate/nitrite transporter-like MFS transporter